MDRMRFAMPRPTPPGLWRRVPPAIFPPILGLMGLALAWRAGVSQFALPPGLSGLLDGIAVALFLFAGLAYGAKLARRPGVLADDLAVLPGRAGTAAGVLCVYLLAGVLGLYAPGLARGVLVIGLLLHVALLAVLVGVLAAGPPEQRRVTPVWHLNWVGFIVAARVAPLIGWDGLARAIFWPALLAAAAIWAISARQLLRERVPPPLRPLLAIHAAPLALLGTTAVMLGQGKVAGMAGLLGAAALVLGLAGARWLTAAGFSPLWGAFTFPLAATAGMFATMQAAHPSTVMRLAAGLSLIVATLIVVPILFLILRDWARGRLATRTNAASA